MSTAKYIWRNCKRNRARSLLTGLSIAVGTALVTLLFGAMAIQQAWCLDTEKYNRVVVTSHQGLFGTLPIAHLPKIRAMENIDSAVPFTWFGGAYQARNNPFAQFATDPSSTLDVWHEFTLPLDESAFSLMFVNMVGDIWRLIQIISMAVCVSLTLVTANSIAMSTRDRRFEFAVLRALGFPQSKIFVTVVGESTLLSAVGCVIGQAAAMGLLELLHRSNARMFPTGIEHIIGAWFVLIFIAAIGIGILSAAIPAAIAARTRIVEAMRPV